MGSLKVLDGGLFTTIQDSGRKGFRKYGVPTSGAMDMKSYELANWLVNNKKGTPVLELTLKGGRYQFESDTVIAITGAFMKPTINSKVVEMNRSIKVSAGDLLEFNFAIKGCRTYVAIHGAMKLKKIMNSYSTYTLGEFGGLYGRILTIEDHLKWKSLEKEYEDREAPKDQIPYFSSKVSVRIMRSIEWDLLDDSTHELFINSRFEVGSKSNRMGIRLESNILKPPKNQMISSPVLPGTIQLPPDGNPIILMQDGQTVGGYPRIAKVLDEDLWRLGQVKTGDKIGFILT